MEVKEKEVEKQWPEAKPTLLARNYYANHEDHLKELSLHVCAKDCYGITDKALASLMVEV